MDVDNDNFYDEIASFMPQPGDYSLDDLDEIIRSTDSHLDASFDLNAFPKTLGNQDDDGDCAMVGGETTNSTADLLAMNMLPPQQQPPPQLMTSSENPLPDFHFDFPAFPSPATSQQSSGDYVSPFDTPLRTSSTSSVDGDCFNPDDFINFLNDDDAKFEDLTPDTIRKLNQHNERNTPSPTGSCTSSSGSSTTSGVHSDSSSLFSVPRNGSEHLATSPEHEQHEDDLSEFIRFKNEKSENSNGGFDEAVDEEMNKDDETTFVAPPPIAAAPGTPALQTNPTLIPVTTLPVVPVATLQPVNIVPGTIIPVQTALPVNKLTPVVNIKTPVKPVVALQQPIPQSQAIKVVTSNTTTTTTPPTANANTAKVTAPPNPKPKTIFLSSNDFKALMQKVNTTNGGASTNGVVAKKSATTPKIIMKTASGKFITANKLGQATTAAVSSAKPVTGVPNTISSLQNGQKLVKGVNQNPMVVKHQQQQSSKLANNSNAARSAAAMAAARATLSSLTSKSGSRNDLNSLRDYSNGDDKILKKQLRMLKNRESASLSRKKKKEYVERLENRIHNLEKENYSLKGENTSLRSQLMAFAQSCNCKNRNVSEFILKTLNINERRQLMEGSGAKTVLNALDTTSFLLHSCDDTMDHQSEHGDVMANNKAATSSTRQHVRIAPKPLNGGTSSASFKGFKHRMNAATVKKNVAVLFAMAFMVTLNVGNFQNYLNRSTALENAMEVSAAAAANANDGETPLVAPTGRRLLWVPNEHEFMEQNNRTKREADFANMPPPPLHFLRPVNRTGRLNGTTTKDEPPIKGVEFGPTAAYGNTTNCAQENMRLARNLHKWIGDNGYLNMTGATMDNHINGQFDYGSEKDYDDMDYEIGVKQKRRKIYLNGDEQMTVTAKQKKYDMGTDGNSLDIFKPRISEEYLKLFKGIKRQDDTFYVLSFNMDHLLLPAYSYNKSARPKMALMLPAGDPSLNGDIVLMQIDCEVMNTTELKIKSHMIPEKLRPVKYGPNVRVHPNDVANNETKNNDAKAPVKPGAEIHLKREDDDKVVIIDKPTSPAAKVYPVVGPKVQGNVKLAVVDTVPTATVKRRPLKFNANDSVIGSGVLNVRNSTLFTRMKETVGASANGFVAQAAPEIFTI
ncbi:uncharacterized protein LOC101891499 isoform X2 [Musca domestica]|uniref:Uncharacterized protein LOC101891499 isoform X2 n=1 Tax=Musca domestica TaxID=7370 RepID=A0A1I8N969_MUSDO|nr:uncharacterized protein LOC101891499 isoform X2 [Musca domestica]